MKAKIQKSKRTDETTERALQLLIGFLPRHSAMPAVNRARTEEKRVDNANDERRRGPYVRIVGLDGGFDFVEVHRSVATTHGGQRA